MANIYKKAYPIPMPEGAEVVQRRGKPMVRWTDGRGRTRHNPLADDGERMMYVSEVWYARYRDLDGSDRRVSTGCRDEQAARKWLADVIAEQEKVRVGFITTRQVAMAEHGKRPVSAHIDDYLAHLASKRVRGRKVSPHYRRNLAGRLRRLTREAGIAKLASITADAVNRWLDKAEEADMAASTRNEYLASMIAFCNWLVRDGRLEANPLARMQKADRTSDRRHVRRALTVEEIGRLLDATVLRPIAEHGRTTVPLAQEDKCGRSTWTYQALTTDNLAACHARGLEKLAKHPHRITELEALGRERKLYYLVALSTGLRRNDIASLTVGQVHLDAVPVPHIHLSAAQAKSGKEANLPLRPDVATLIREYLEERGPDLPLDRRLFVHPVTIRIFDADCQAAGIPKADRRGRVVDIHALRVTFGTHLAVANVHPRVAQAALRHSRIELTTNFYTDPALLDVNGAVNALPDWAGAAAGAGQASVA